MSSESEQGMEIGEDNMAEDLKKNLEKECLEPSTLFVNRWPEEIAFTANMRFTWEIHYYSTLEPDVVYCKGIESKDFRWILQFVKSKGTLFLFLLSKDVPRAHVNFYLYRPDYLGPQRIYNCDRICEGLYVAQVCTSTIENPDNNLLVNDVLTVYCSYRTRTLEKGTVPDDQSNIESDGQDLCEDFKDLYLSRLLSDFILVSSDDKPFYVHKLVLCARSEFFKDIFDEDYTRNSFGNRVRISAHSLSIECILMYMYCGELRDVHIETLMEIFRFAAVLKMPLLVKKCKELLNENLLKTFISKESRDLDLKNVMGVLDTAAVLKIDSVTTKCEIILKKSVSRENVREILALATKHNLEGLEKKCLSYDKRLVQNSVWRAEPAIERFRENTKKVINVNMTNGDRNWLLV